MARGTVTPINKDSQNLTEFEERTVSIRGSEFTIRELSAEEYDTCLKSATKADGDVDMVLLLRLMTLKSLQAPKMSAEEISKLPYRISRRLGSAVNELHFGDDEED